VKTRSAEPVGDALGTGKRAMVYRRTHQVVKRLAARRSAILAAARDAAADGGMAAVQIAPVAVRANVAAGTVYRYFPSKADLISELIAEVSRDELAAIRRAAEAAPGPSSAHLTSRVNREAQPAHRPMRCAGAKKSRSLTGQCALSVAPQSDGVAAHGIAGCGQLSVAAFLLAACGVRESGSPRNPASLACHATAASPCRGSASTPYK